MGRRPYATNEARCAPQQNSIVDRQLWVIFVRSTRSRRSRHVRFAPIASEPSHRSESTRCAKTGREQMQQKNLYSITSSARPRSGSGTVRKTEVFRQDALCINFLTSIVF
jgi:hypothetical protein